MLSVFWGTLLTLPLAPGVSAQQFAPNPGTGTLSEDFALPPELADQLSTAESEYSAYELSVLSVNDPRKKEDFVPQSVFEPDDREPVVLTTDFPARAVVQILFRTDAGASALCSGAMIAPDTVLTAAHCLHSGTDKGVWYTDFQILPGRNKGSLPFSKCTGIKAYVLDPWKALTRTKRTRVFDLGALKLDCEIGVDTGWFGMVALDDEALGRATTVHGYANDMAPAGTQWKSDDKIRVLEPLKAFYLNDTFGGTSGSPVYTGDDRHIFCVHTNGSHNGHAWRNNNACTRITKQRLAVIGSWIEDGAQAE